MDIGQDGGGNSWVLLIHLETGEPEAVLYASHDAPVILVAEDSFDLFCRKLVSDPGRFIEIIETREQEIYRRKSKGISFDEARASVDSVLQELADRLDDSWRVFDLRPMCRLRGFLNLANFAIDYIQRHPTKRFCTRKCKTAGLQTMLEILEIAISIEVEFGARKVPKWS